MSRCPGCRTRTDGGGEPRPPRDSLRSGEKLSAVATSLGAPKTKDRAHSSANALLASQQDARIFLNVDLDGLEEEDAREQLRTLVARQQELNATAEIPSARAWKRAQRNIAGGRQTYVSSCSGRSERDRGPTSRGRPRKRLTPSTESADGRGRACTGQTMAESIVGG
jgi:hypothetical protein